jgi:hypothetical protein
VLFSSDTVATYINNAFEPVWGGVRPVRIVTIDFGNGHTITRTLHGNIATYLCSADGAMFDILPGIYEPAAYRAQLEQFALLHRHTHQQFVPRNASRDEEIRRRELAEHVDTRLRVYHERQARLLKMNQPADVLARNLNGGRGKEKSENAVELVAGGEGFREGSHGKLVAPPTENRELRHGKLVAQAYI